MKKIIILTLMAFMATIVAEAQGYRRWDFTKWSQQTIDNLIADAEQGDDVGWSDQEYLGSSTPVDNKCFWYQDGNNYGTMKANGQIIAELEGLDFSQEYVTNRSLAIAVDYPSTNIGTYDKGQYLWLGINNAAYAFRIPSVMVGEKITMSVESHRSGQGRGVGIYLMDADGNMQLIGDTFTPDARESHTWENWMLPEGVADNGGMVDIYVKPTSGCHIYTIEIGENTEASNVAFLYDGELGADLAYQSMSGDYNNKVTAIQANRALTFEELDAYDAVVISSTVNNAKAVESLWTLQPFLPMLNLNPSLYEIWGCGQVVESGTDVAVVANPAHSLFKGLELFSDSEAENPIYGVLMTSGSSYPCVTLSGIFADDPVLATAYEKPQAIAIHTHNIGHNGYIYIPYSQQIMPEAASPQLLTNAAKLLGSSKAPITQTPTPVISLQYEDMSTIVSISVNLPRAEIYYTTDGSEPTEQSTPYTGPFTLSQEMTVKAIAKGEGYLLSPVAEKDVDLRVMAPMPIIAFEKQDGKTIVTISSDLEGSKIYYNYKGDGTTQKSSPYNGPITLTRGKTVYAFQTCEGYLDSKVTSQQVSVMNPHVRIDVLAQMDANQDTYYERTNKSASNAGYYFSWANTNNYPYYDPEFDETVVGSDGNDSIVHHKLNSEEKVDFENGWSLRSRGQRVSWEGANPELNYGDSGSGPCNPATVEDEDTCLPVSPFIINFFDWDTQYPASAKIQTTQPIAGPFDYVIYIVNYKGSPYARLVVEVATDPEAEDAGWKQLGDTIDLNPTRRLYQMYVRSYEETTPVYTRMRTVNNGPRAGIFNIYITNEGEESKKLIEEQQTGIMQTTRETAVPTTFYNINGVRLQQMCRGINIVHYSDGTSRKIILK